MLINEIDIQDVIRQAHKDITELGRRLISRRKRRKDVAEISSQINAIAEGVGYLESQSLTDAEKLKVANRLIEIGDIRPKSTGIYQGDQSGNSETVI